MLKHTLLFWLASAVIASSAQPFRALTFDAARRTAAQERKLVFIDFYTTWCGPCKQLDETTWKDPAVVELLNEKTIALKIDAEKQTALAERYKISAYPTLLLLTPEGAERDRIVGYRDAKTFTAEFKAALAGQDALSRAKEEVENSGANNPSARMKLGRELENKGRYADALQEYLWCFDEGGKHDPAYSGVRLSFLLSDLSRLGQRFAPAREALVARRDAAEKLVLSGATDNRAILELTRLNSILGLSENNLVLFDRLPADHKGRAMLLDVVCDQLLSARRYDEILKLGNPHAALMQEMRRWNAVRSRFKEGETAGDPLKQYYHGKVISTGGKYLEALAGAGQTDEAKAWADQILKFDASAETRNRLVKHAETSENTDLVAYLKAK